MVCPGVEGHNLAAAAVRALRERVDLPPLLVTIDKRLPVAAGLAGGSADAAATLRAANAVAGCPLDADGLRAVARGLGSDVPSQVEPASAVVHGTGERVDRVELAPMGLVLLPDPDGLSTAAVYAELDRLRADGEAPSARRARPGTAQAAGRRAPGAAGHAAGERPPAGRAVAASRAGRADRRPARGRRPRGARQRLGPDGVRRLRRPRGGAGRGGGPARARWWRR